MMNSTTFISSQQKPVPKTETASAGPFLAAEGDMVEFEHLMRGTERPVVATTTAKDKHGQEDATTNGTLSEMGGLAMNMRTVDLNVPLNLSKSTEPVQTRESSGRTAEVAAGERVERKDGGDQETQRHPAKAETNESSDSTEIEEKPSNEGTVETVEKEKATDEPQAETEDSVLDGEAEDISETEEITEIPELEPEIEQIEDLPEEIAELEPEAEVDPEVEMDSETEMDLEAEIDLEAEMDPEAEMEIRPERVAHRAARGAQKQGSMGNKNESAQANVLGGMKTAPNQQSMLNTAKNVATLEQSALEDFSTDSAFDMDNSPSDQFGGSNMDSSENMREMPQPILNVQGVAATGQSAGVASTIFSAASPQVTALLETIWNRVTTFRARGDSSWTVQIRPDDQTKMQLTIKMGATGLEIITRLQQGDMQRLGTTWGDLQNALSERGVRLHDLEAEEARSDSAETFDMEMFGNESETASSETEDRNAEEGFAPIESQPETRPDQEIRPRRTSTHNGFESWA